MPERFYEQDPNTGQRYYTEKGWSEWKPVPVEKDPSTGEEYELWNEQWIKKAPAEEVPAEMPSLAKGGMLVAGSANVAEDRMRRWKQANPKKAARAQKILASGREIDPTGALGTELGMVLGGEWDADKPMDYATLSKAVREQGKRAVEAEFDQQVLEAEVKKFEGMSPFVKPAYIAGRAVLSGVPTGVKGLVDIVRTIDDVITQSKTKKTIEPFRFTLSRSMFSIHCPAVLITRLTPSRSRTRWTRPGVRRRSIGRNP